MNSSVDSNIPLIENDFVKCYSDYLSINLYYFPYGNKKVKYENIRSCDLLSTDDMDLFNCKHWGMALSPIWWHCDMKRLGRKHYILIDANQWPKIGLTMDDNDIINVYNFIRQKILLNQSNISKEKLPYHSNQIISDKEREHRESLENNKTN